MICHPSSRTSYSGELNTRTQTAIPFKFGLAILFLMLSLTSLHLNAGTLYLPVNLSPEIEARVEKLFVVANMPIVKRPISVKLVNQAIRKVEDTHPNLATSVRSYLQRFGKLANLSHVSVIASLNDGATYSTPNNRGFATDSAYQVSANGYWAVSEYAAMNIGVIAGQRPNAKKERFAEGTFLSLGIDAAQVDLGYRSHWWGPSMHSNMLVSSQAPAVPSITISNAEPFDFAGFNYEVFFAQLSETNGIKSAEQEDTYLTGKPRLFGMHLSFAPFDGFAIGFNRLMQYGGADRDSSVSGLLKAFFNVKSNENAGQGKSDFGNQLSSITTAYTFTGLIPVKIYMELGGEDTSAASDVHLGNSSMMFGIHLPRLFTDQIDLSLETSEWQNAWYVNGNYQDGLSNHGMILGHWGGQQRKWADGVSARTNTAKLLWAIKPGHTLSFDFKQVNNKNNAVYKTGNALSTEYAHSVDEFIMGFNFVTGNDVLGDDFSQISAFFRW